MHQFLFSFLFRLLNTFSHFGFFSCAHFVFISSLRRWDSTRSIYVCRQSPWITLSRLCLFQTALFIHMNHSALFYQRFLHLCPLVNPFHWSFYSIFTCQLISLPSFTLINVSFFHTHRPLFTIYARESIFSIPWNHGISLPHLCLSVSFLHTHG